MANTSVGVRRLDQRGPAAVHPARDQPGALGRPQPQGGAAVGAGDPREAAPGRRRRRVPPGPGHSRAPRRGVLGRSPAGRPRPRPSRGTRREHHGAGAGHGQTGRRATRQPGADPGRGSGRSLQVQPRADLCRRAHRRGPSARRHARDRPALQTGSELPAIAGVLPGCGVDDRPGLEAAADRRGRPVEAGGRERTPARRVTRSVRVPQHHRQQCADPAGLRAGRAGGSHQHDRADPGRVGHG